MLDVCIIDDEPLARERMRSLLERAEIDVSIVGEAGNGREAIPMIHEKRPSLIFLDIQMPGLTGFDVVDLIAPPLPHIVFVTAYDQYALQAFEVHALDYLTKPVSLDRLNRSLHRITKLISERQAEEGLDTLQEARKSQPLRKLTLQLGKKMRVVDPEEVRYFEAKDKLVFARLFDGKEYPTHFTLQTLEQRLDEALFIRSHRAFLVNIHTIRELSTWFSGTYQMRLDDNTLLPVSRRRARTVKEILNG